MSDSTSRLPARPSLEQLHKQARELLQLYRAGESTAIVRFRACGRPLPRAASRGRVALADAQFVLAREYGFDSWAKLKHHIQALPHSRSAPHGLSSTPPFYRIDWKENQIEPRQPLSDKDWDTIFGLMKEMHITGLDSARQMTDAALERLSHLDHVTRLNLAGSKQLTDIGLNHLARMPRLQHLDLTACSITDRGLDVLSQLRELKGFYLYHHHGVSDAGVANLAHCDQLERVDLLGTTTGDGVISALAGKPGLRHFKSGSQVTDSGLTLLHQFPVFKTWQGGEVSIKLMEFTAEPNHLLLRGSFTDKGLASLVGLDGLFALNLDDSQLAVTTAGLKPLSALPNLGWLAFDATDDAMPHIAAMPRLRMLMCQDTVAGDAGFAALSRSQSIEYIWGRRCHNLTGLGFAAMAAMPALRGLSVSCKNVDDTALSALPRFPALREFMPMDVPDDGFRHLGRCRQLEALWCMYCQDTGDAATNHIASLSLLTTYYAGKTQISDRSLEILGRMLSLEKLTFWQCHGITDAGLAALARLPRLSDINLEGLPNVTREAIAAFPANVRVNYRP
jgi:hypothetical protein